jgi:hypothetical protein
MDYLGVIGLRYPGSQGRARPALIEDASLLADWLLVFLQEAVPHDPVDRISVERT